MAPPRNFDYAATAVVTLGMMPGLVGINSLLRPAHALSLLGFPSPPDAQARKLAHSLMQMAGARNLTMTLATLAVWFTADRRTLGYTMLAGAPLALIDGFISRGVVDGMEWGHWTFVPVSLGLGALLALR
ncbi:hypothetical protein B0T10DRAFT_498555 [Thelonectria olida]|uniref:DUF4267 domain-containing protein n=1 Tax=Thelonectria olida TaxID=1576542 RepID=A0A9P8VSF5_9HYPO|nr:hypothetical protein B0T10DRAFT_498555 [Thelonectria olida]